MKKIILVSILWVVSVSLQAVIIPRAPALSATAYILIDANSGKVIVEKNSNEQIPPASLTKMMTSYITTDEIALGNISLEDNVLVSQKAGTKGGSKMFIREGSKVKLHDLLKGIIIQSGNDASVAMAEHIGGSEKAFVAVMNEYAEHLGLTNTHYMNSTGLPEEGHYSSATDIATLAQAIITKHPEYYSLYKEKYFEYEGIRQPNRNKLLWQDPHVDGLKTGHTKEAGYCLAVSSLKNGMRLIAVVLGTDSSQARTKEAKKLLFYGYRYFKTHTIYSKGQEIESERVFGGVKEKLRLTVANNMLVTVPKNSRDELKVDMLITQYVKAPIVKGANMGKVVVSYKNEILLEEPLLAMEKIDSAGFFAKLWAKIQVFFMKLIS
jgi:D-alanyl-D-alanine carboxypeptidase (penicillin-binding protein 5/6)